MRDKKSLLRPDELGDACENTNALETREPYLISAIQFHFDLGVLVFDYLR